MAIFGNIKIIVKNKKQGLKLFNFAYISDLKKITDEVFTLPVIA